VTLFNAFLGLFTGGQVQLGYPGTPPFIDNGPLSDSTATLNSIYHPIDPSIFRSDVLQNIAGPIVPIPDEDFFRHYVYIFYGDDIGPCLKKVFKKDANKIPKQTYENSPALDTSQSSAELKAQSSQKDNPDVLGVAGLPLPDKGPNGTVAIANGLWNSTASMEDRAHSYVHELGNILSYKASGSYTKYGDPNGVYYPQFGNTVGYKDYDSGANFERCVFGKTK
jgi:hypothetical protein